jgi:hypothetical protein
MVYLRYLYLIHEKQHENKNIYKIGKMPNIFMNDLKKEKNGTKVLFSFMCDNCEEWEKKMLELFDKKYERFFSQQPPIDTWFIYDEDYNSNYYRGDENVMILDMCKSLNMTVDDYNKYSNMDVNVISYCAQKNNTYC